MYCVKVPAQEQNAHISTSHLNTEVLIFIWPVEFSGKCGESSHAKFAHDVLLHTQDVELCASGTAPYTLFNYTVMSFNLLHAASHGDLWLKCGGVMSPLPATIRFCSIFFNEEGI